MIENGLYGAALPGIADSLGWGGVWRVRSRLDRFFGAGAADSPFSSPSRLRLVAALVVGLRAGVGAETTRAGAEAGAETETDATDVARDESFLFFAGGFGISSALSTAFRLPFLGSAILAAAAALVLVVFSSSPNIFRAFRARCPRPPISPSPASTMSIWRLLRALAAGAAALAVVGGILGAGALPSFAFFRCAAFLDNGFLTPGTLFRLNFSQKSSLSWSASIGFFGVLGWIQPRQVCPYTSSRRASFLWSFIHSICHAFIASWAFPAMW